MWSSFWKKSLVCGVLLLFAGVGILPGIHADVTNIKNNNENNVEENLIPLDQLDQYQTEGGRGYLIHKTSTYAQSFKPAFDKLTKVELYICKYGEVSSPFTLSIKENLNGETLTSVSVSPNQIGTEKAWIIFDISDIDVIPESTYYLVASSSTGDSYTSYVWETSYWGVDAYSRGCLWEYLNLQWYPQDNDACFKTYRTGSVPNTPNQPSGPTSGLIGVTHTFTTSAIDLDNDRIKYGWDWNGDYIVDEWKDNDNNYYTSGIIITASHNWEVADTYPIQVIAEDTYFGQSEWSPALWVIIREENQPPATPSITGLTNGKTGEEYEYKFLSTDPEEDQIYYYIDWGDNTSEQTIGPYESGYERSAMHRWSNDGTYIIRAKTRDVIGYESDWATLTVTMPYTMKPPFQQFLDWLFQQFPHAFPLLRNLMGN